MRHFLLALLVAMFIFFATIQAFCQPSPTVPTYQPATITDVEVHQPAADSNPADTVYQISLQVNGTVYVVLATSPLDTGSIRYATGREMLVLVGENTITWNDIMGKSHVAPIVSTSVLIKNFTPKASDRH